MSGKDGGMKKSRIILADTNSLFTDALRFVLGQEADFEIETRDETDADSIRSILAAKPDVMVIHQLRPDSGVVQILREVKRRLKDIHILFIVKETTAELFSLASESSSVGIMSEGTNLAEFMEALRAVARGERYISKEILSAALPQDDDEFYDDPLGEITPREREVLYWLSHGLTNREIAQRMILSEKTVKNHVSHMLKKLDLTDRTKAAALAWREGLPQIAEEFFSLPAVQPMLK